MPRSEIRLWPVPVDAREFKCRGCDAPIVFGRTDRGKTIPLSATSKLAVRDAQGVLVQAPSHSDCPAANQFMRNRK